MDVSKKIRFHEAFAGLALTSLLLSTTPASAQSAANVLLVINDASPASVEVGEYYAKVREIPKDNVAHITTVQTESISRPEYEKTIETPLACWIEKYVAQDQILYIVLTKGVPLRIDGSAGREGTTSSVDSELAMLYRKMTSAVIGIAGQLPNPYFLGERAINSAKHFNHEDFDIYLVTRLDGYAFDDIKGLIDRGLKPSRNGRIVLDQRATTADRGGDMWLSDAAELLRKSGQSDRLLLEATRAVAETPDQVIGYFSWGSNDPSNQLRDFGLKFSPGAIGGLFVSTDARTFREPKPEWIPALTAGGNGGQTLVGDLIREGITGISGHVSEPYLDAIERPQILFPAYLAGFNLAESFYLSMPSLSWQSIVIGDPLCSPFASGPYTIKAVPIDAETGLPELFSRRSMAALSRTGFREDALKLNLRALSLKAQEHPESEQRPLLEKATELEPRLAQAHLQLASNAEQRGDYVEAEKRYRLVLAADPNDAVALNNLAFLLADKYKKFDEAPELAEKAYRQSGQSPLIADTLGWIYYLRGDYMQAKTILEKAAAADPTNVDVQVHAASASMALRDPAKAKKYLDQALRADPKAAERADVKELQAKIIK